jgi:hypothetical protein
LVPSEPVLGALTEMEIEGRGGYNVAFRARQKFTDFLNYV